LVITLKVGGLLHLFEPPKRLQIGHLLTAHMRRIPNTSLVGEVEDFVGVDVNVTHDR
jgi:hypothetical protein